MKMAKFGIVIIFLFVFVQCSLSNATIITINNEAVWQTTVGSWRTADFEDFVGPANNQYTGVTFSGANGGSPYSTNIFPHEGNNSMFSVLPWNAGGGGWAASFDNPIQAFAFWSDDVQFVGSTVSIFDSSNDLLASYDLMGSGGGHGPYLYGFNGFVSDAFDIAHVEISINSTDAIWFDNFQYSSANTPVPEPTTCMLLFTGLIGLVGIKRRKGKC